MFDNYLKITCIKYVLHNNYSYLERSRNDTRLNKALDTDRWIGFSLNYGIIDSTDICRPFCQIMLLKFLLLIMQEIHRVIEPFEKSFLDYRVISTNNSYLSWYPIYLFLLSFFAWNCISFYFIISNEHYVRRTFKNMVERKIWEFIEFVQRVFPLKKKINSSSIFLINPIDFITSISKIDKTISTMP